MIAGKLVQVQSKAKPKTTTKSASRKIAQSPSPSVVRSKGSRPNKGEESSEGDNDDRDDDEEDDEEDFGGHVVKSRIGSRTDAEKLIAEILCRLEAQHQSVNRHHSIELPTLFKSCLWMERLNDDRFPRIILRGFVIGSTDA